MFTNPGGILKGVVCVIVGFGVIGGLFVLAYSILNG